MKTLLRRLVDRALARDALMSMLVVPGAYLLRKYRDTGSQCYPRTTARLRKIGVFPITNHYYEPLFDDRLLERPLALQRPLPGIDLNIDGQLALLGELARADELRQANFAGPRASELDFRLDNGSFGEGDADFLYQILRWLKPAKIVEVGSGHSTKVARLALECNRAETGVAAVHVCIEPYEQPWLEKLGGVSVVRSRVEHCSIDWANELAPGDLLFIDSSHMIRPQGDVLEEYLSILPRLRAGVYVHVHDVFTPRDYPRAWVVDDVKFWNEQYLLEALLTDTDRYEVVAALNHLKHEHYDALARVCPYLEAGSEPGSFYLRTK